MAAVFPAIATGLGGAGAAAGAAGAMGTISTVLSAGMALSSIAQGNIQSAALKEQAAWSRANERQEAASGAQERADLAKEYEGLVAEQSVVAAANGLQLGVGTPANVRQATRDEADRRFKISSDNTRARVANARLRTRGLGSQAARAKFSGYADAIGIGLNQFQLVG